MRLLNPDGTEPFPPYIFESARWPVKIEIDGMAWVAMSAAGRQAAVDSIRRRMVATEARLANRRRRDRNP